MERRIIFYCGLIACLLLVGLDISAQQIEPQQDTTKSRKINIHYSDLAEGYKEGDSDFRKLSGQVELRQDSVFLSCDTAIVNVTNNDVIAYGNVIIQQGDSLNVFSDSIYYAGNDKKAQLFDEVVLVNGEQQIFTDQLNYDLDKKVATYYSGAILTDGETQLSSKIGYYYIASETAYFKDSVTVVGEDFQLRADTLQFNTESRVVTFLGPTRIDQDEAKIYCEEGFYDILNDKAEFRKNAQYLKDGQSAVADKMIYNGASETIDLVGNASFEDQKQRATADLISFNEKTNLTTLSGNAYFEDGEQTVEADQIVYDGKTKSISTKGRSSLVKPPQFLEADQIDFDDQTGLGIAKGDVIWRDSSENISITCDNAEYIKNEDYLKAYGERTLLMSVFDEDTLYLSSDTLVSQRTESFDVDSSRMFFAYEDVRVLKTDFQAVCDSLVYNGQDSIFKFYHDPVVWSDTSQFMADTIIMFTTNNNLDSIQLQRNSFIINSPDEIFFNQIKGRDINAFFINSEIFEMNVLGNAESVYYLIDESKAYIAVNKTICSDMKLDFGDNEVEKINCYPEPKANLMPMRNVNHNEIKLEGFNWIEGRRPRLISDLLKKS